MDFLESLLRPAIFSLFLHFRHRLNMKCIIFVNRIVIARSLSYILQNLEFLAFWKCDYLVGVHSKLRSMSRKTMNHILMKFRSGEVSCYIKPPTQNPHTHTKRLANVTRYLLVRLFGSARHFLHYVFEGRRV